ncbi:hypothetical protein Ccrd_004078 [Cynara cardunculus var. scolymus]|uniref:Uncharacterized protein n=1 Tax=Cynara cardunculus var. scolymus TaxID=59895 RepID=A0A103XNA1_CYNCS|nr:hypothetical protein Ccrd_004078 [Cynara cardunculus var. scolymus]
MDNSFDLDLALTMEDHNSTTTTSSTTDVNSKRLEVWLPEDNISAMLKVVVPAATVVTRQPVQVVFRLITDPEHRTGKNHNALLTDRRQANTLQLS